MPRYIKRQNLPVVSDLMKKVDDRVLQGVEVGGITYLVSKYSGGKSTMNKAIMVGVLVSLNEFVLNKYF